MPCPRLCWIRISFAQGLIPAEKIEYTRAQDDYVFELLLKAAEYNLNRGRHVILDGRTFTRRYQVERVVLFANEVGAESALY